ncbi:MAG TPA: hypothetical protein VGR35_21875 [Tepidisphaeraceae bacterium]|nr:hypothetical protein [Tepidisphaeraceae bacterium]
MELLILLVIALPPLVIGILIWGWVRETDVGRRRRGFEVKRTTGETTVQREEHQAD